MELENNICSSTLDLFLQLGIRSVSMDDICRKLGISKKTLYQVVDSKEELINMVTSAHMQNEMLKVQELREQSINAIDETLQCGKHFLQFFRKMSPTFVHDLQKYYGPIWDRVRSQHMEHDTLFVQQNLERGIEEGLYRDNLKPYILAKMYVHTCMNIADEFIFPLSEYTRAELYIEAINYHLQGIVTKKGADYLKSTEIRYRNESK